MGGANSKSPTKKKQKKSTNNPASLHRFPQVVQEGVRPGMHVTVGQPGAIPDLQRRSPSDIGPPASLPMRPPTADTSEDEDNQDRETRCAASSEGPCISTEQVGNSNFLEAVCLLPIPLARRTAQPNLGQMELEVCFVPPSPGALWFGAAGRSLSVRTSFVPDQRAISLCTTPWLPPAELSQLPTLRLVAAVGTTQFR